MKNQICNLLSGIQGKPVFVYDTETTGLSSANCDIIQFSALRCQVNRVVDTGEYKFLVDGAIDIYINPGYSIPTYITRINGISNRMIYERGVPSRNAADMIREFLGDEPIMIGYNSISFDRNFVNKLFLRELGCPFVPQNEIDVLQLARRIIPKYQIGGSYRLENVADFFGVSDSITFHSAIDDAKATLLVLERLINS